MELFILEDIDSSIYSHAKYYISRLYAGVHSSIYYGSFFGDKLSGMTSDPNYSKYMDTQDDYLGQLNNIAAYLEQSKQNKDYQKQLNDFYDNQQEMINDYLDKYNDLEELKNKLKKIERNNPKLEKWDCYEYCKPNLEIITREIIRQYKEQKNNDSNTKQ